MLVQQIMSPTVACCYLTDTLDRAATVMWNCDSGALPVLDHDGHAIAMVTDRDVCMAALTQGKPLFQIRVNSAMSKTLYACRPDDDLARAQALMHEHQLRRIPVLDQEARPVGMITIGDLVRVATHASGALRDLGDGLSANSLTYMLAAVYAHRLRKSNSIAS
jgi:CBS domain-containing protein